MERNSMDNGSFEANLTFIREAIEEIIKPPEIGAYIEDSKRLYRARKFQWIKSLVTQIQQAKANVTDAQKCQTLVYLAIDELIAIRTIKKLEKYDFYRCEKKLIQALHAIIIAKDTTVDNIATSIIKAIRSEPIYTQETRMLNIILITLGEYSEKIGLHEAAKIFRSAVQ